MKESEVVEIFRNKIKDKVFIDKEDKNLLKEGINDLCVLYGIDYKKIKSKKQGRNSKSIYSLKIVIFYLLYEKLRLVSFNDIFNYLPMAKVSYYRYINLIYKNKNIISELDKDIIKIPKLKKILEKIQ